MAGLGTLILLFSFLGTTCFAINFDYVIVGGGPAGLVLANRLSANPNTTVAVIEAGSSVFNNTNVTDVSLYGLSIGTSIDWSYSSAPQRYTSNRTLTYSAGKALGGTTTINGMTYLRAEHSQIDAWERLGNPGWNWSNLWPYYLKSEGFETPEPYKIERGATFNSSYHGFDGHVATGWSKYLMGSGAAQVLRNTSENLEIPFNVDANGGQMRGFTASPSTLNATTNTRADAARSYYYGISSRQNLYMFLNTTATRLVWDDRSASLAKVAKGVEVVTGGKMNCLRAKEIIISAGSIRSPALLEHSGVGNPLILEPLSITTEIDLPGVGANLQDQPNVVIAYSSPKNWTGYPVSISYTTAEDLFGSSLPNVTAALQANLSAYAATIAANEGSITNATALYEPLKVLADIVFGTNSTIPLAEIVWAPGPGAFTTGFQTFAAAHWNLLPFSRGSIHINSTDPLAQPQINPNFFQLPIDTWIQAAIGVQMRKYFATPPLSTYVTTEVLPGNSTVPMDARYDDPTWETYIKSTYGPNTHPIATCAMMSRELGGVVDPTGKVYGTENVRVVDASIFPMQVSGHLSGNIYAVAERIADLILAGK